MTEAWRERREEGNEDGTYGEITPLTVSAIIRLPDSSRIIGNKTCPTTKRESDKEENEKVSGSVSRGQIRLASWRVTLEHVTRPARSSTEPKTKH